MLTGCDAACEPESILSFILSGVKNFYRSLLDADLARSVGRRSRDNVLALGSWRSANDEGDSVLFGMRPRGQSEHADVHRLIALEDKRSHVVLTSLALREHESTGKRGLDRTVALAALVVADEPLHYWYGHLEINARPLGKLVYAGLHASLQRDSTLLVPDSYVLGVY